MSQFIRHTCFTLLIVAVIMSIASGTAAAADADRIIVLVSVDGLAAFYLDDPKADMPNLRALAKQGARARGMITSFPSVTWPSHTSLVTGATAARHGVLDNSTYNRATDKIVTYIGDKELTKAEAVKTGTLYDVAHEAGLKTASIIWPACNGAPTLNWMIPDSNQAAMHEQYTTPGFIAELEQAGIPAAKLPEWGWKKEHSTARDDTYTAIAEHLLAKHRPNLLLIHLITPDGVQHATGPHTDAAYEAVAQADRHIGRIWQALQATPAGRAGKATLFVVSDHGFAPYDKQININVVLRQMGLITEGDKAGEMVRRAWSKGGGGSAAIHVFDEAQRAKIIIDLKPKLAALEGVDVALDAGEFTKLGLPSPDANPEQGHLMLAAKPGYVFNEKTSGDEVITALGEQRGAHGHLPTREFMHASFIAVGAGIRPGSTIEIIRNIDVAPTISRLLGVEMPTAEGRAIGDILE